MPGGFLGGARDRLLAASIPFRFFLAAAAFHVAAWGALFLTADLVPSFAGGGGPVLAAIHLATLGVFAMTAVGASYQLLPVVTRRPLARDWPARLSFWLMLPGVCLLTWGMHDAAAGAMQTGGALVTAGLGVFAVLTADNLRRAGSLPVVAAHGWGAVASLIGLAALGLMLIVSLRTGFLRMHGELAVLHMVLASFGFMGLLVLGLSLVLIPMFTLSRSQPQRPGWLQLALAVLALAAFSAGSSMDVMGLKWAALLAGAGSAAIYLWQMRNVLAARMRKRLDLAFLLIRVSWVFLAASLMLAPLALAGADIPNLPALFGFLVLAGWLLTFLTGVLQRIMPFLASMHASNLARRPPPPSSQTAELPLRVHAACHLTASVFCLAGIALDFAVLVRLGAALGVIGALSFAGFAVNVVLKLRAFGRES